MYLNKQIAKRQPGYIAVSMNLIRLALAVKQENSLRCWWRS